jgi:molecular chaperone HscC
VLDLVEGVMEVRAAAGYNFLGGEDFDSLLVEQFFGSAKAPVRLNKDS